jgi:hypothetical protein
LNGLPNGMPMPTLPNPDYFLFQQQIKGSKTFAKILASQFFGLKPNSCVLSCKTLIVSHDTWIREK